MNQKPGEKPDHKGPHREKGPGGVDKNNPVNITPRPNDPARDHLPPVKKPGDTWKPPKK